MPVLAENRPPILQFSIFEVDLRAGELRRSGLKVKLQEQPFQILAVLLEKPGEVISRDELRSRLWPADTFVDFDHGLNAAVRRLRDALGDSAETPRFVETVARRGYRFIAPVNPSPAAPNAATPQVVKTRVTQRRWSIFAAVCVLLVLALVFGILLGRRRIPVQTEITQRRLTANPSEDPVTAATISPDGAHVAFSDYTGLYLREVETGETHALPLPPAFDAKPASWFPDSNHLVVVGRSTPVEEQGLWALSVFGAAPRKLIDKAFGASVSPDGSQIAFLRGPSGQQEIWSMQSDGERPRRLAGGSAVTFGEIAWSPDSRRIAYPRSKYVSPYTRADSWIEVLDLDNGHSEVVLRDPRLGSALVWTHEGRLIYSLIELPPNQDESNLWCVQADARGRPVGSATRVTSESGFVGEISVGAVGTRLAFIKQNIQPDVYIAGLEAQGKRLTTPQRLTLDERQDYPYAWTLDGKAVLFTSDRDGVFHIFKQQIDQPTPELLVGGKDDVITPRLSPDGSTVLYLIAPKMKDTSNNVRLMRIPLSGGAPQLLLEESGITNQQCARLPSTLCIFSVIGTNEEKFFAFDPVKGKGQEIAKAAIQSGDYYEFNWSLSPNGEFLASSRKIGRPEPIIRLLSLSGPDEKTVEVKGWAGFSYIDWAADSNSLWLSAYTNTGTRALLNVDLQGKVRSVLEENKMILGWAIPSPDGRFLALWKANGSSNVWILEGF